MINLVQLNSDGSYPDPIPLTQTGQYPRVGVTTDHRLQVETAITFDGPTTNDTGLSRYRNTALTSTAVALKASLGNVFGVNFINVNTTPVYVKFYNAAVVDTTVGTTTPQHVITIPAGDGVTPGAILIPATEFPVFHFATAITIAAVTGLADNSTTAPSTAVYAESQYK